MPGCVRGDESTGEACTKDLPAADAVCGFFLHQEEDTTNQTGLTCCLVANTHPNWTMFCASPPVQGHTETAAQYRPRLCPVVHAWTQISCYPFLVITCKSLEFWVECAKKYHTFHPFLRCIFILFFYLLGSEHVTVILVQNTKVF